MTIKQLLLSNNEASKSRSSDDVAVDIEERTWCAFVPRFTGLSGIMMTVARLLSLVDVADFAYSCSKAERRFLDSNQSHVLYYSR